MTYYQGMAEFEEFIFISRKLVSLNLH